MKPEVIIVGAGAAGLGAAKVLSEAGRSVAILEARNRIGGRILTHSGGKRATPIDLGAEFVHGRPEVTWKLIREFGLRAVDLPFDHRRRQGGKLSQLPDVNTELDKVMHGLTHLGRADMSFAEYLRKHRFKRSSPAVRFAINFVEGFDAADIERISAKSLAEEHEGIGNLDDETQFRLVDGYGTLIESLRRSLNPKRVTIALNTPVGEIRWNKSKVEIVAGKPDRPQRLKGKHAIITLPLGVLQIPPEVKGSIRFAPDIPEKREAAARLASGSVVKVILQFSESFWEDPAVARAANADEGLRDASFFHIPDATFPTWWTLRPMRVPILTGWVGGPQASALAGRSKTELLEAAVSSLAALFKQSPGRLRAWLVDFHFHDWISDPFSRGAYSYVVAGGMNARAELAKPVGKTLFFAGEACDTSGQASTVAGALASGQRAAKQILAM